MPSAKTAAASAPAGEEAFRLRAMRFFRKKRMRAFERMFALDDVRLLDIGGTPFNWSMIEARPRITMVNIKGEVGQRGNIDMRLGDATCLGFEDMSFDLVYSNSVIEHVGGPEKVRAFAAEVRRLAPAYYVQTPNKWFPIEPHCFGLILHWLPMPIRRRLYRWLSISGLRNKPNQAQIDRYLRGIDLLTRGRLRELFPDAEIIAERVWFFPFVPKSFVVVRRATPAA